MTDRAMKIEMERQMLETIAGPITSSFVSQ